MSTINEDYTFHWNDHAYNFSFSFQDLFQSKDLIDVKLVADGYLFDAHRLVLSALSPYFRQMFTQMPANQQAYVFMKDVSKQAIEDLITFIYYGEVKVAQENVDDFLQTAAALKIKGLADGCYKQAFDSRASTSTGSAAAYNRLQYQSSRTVQVPKSANRNVTHSDSSAFQFQNDFERSDSMNGNGCEMDMNLNHFDVYDFGNDHSAIVAQDYQWNANSQKDFNETQTKSDVPQVKRSKQSLNKTDFNFVADIRQKEFGGKNLFHNGFKYSKYGKGVRTQPWRCSKSAAKECRATVTTTEIDGVIMMKVLHANHTHKPDDSSETNELRLK